MAQRPSSTEPMSAQIFLLTPPAIAPARLVSALGAAVATTPAAALLLRRGAQGADAYRALVAAVLPAAQEAGVAVLVEDDAALARKTGADGVHVSGGIDAVAAALETLKPGLIVGAGPVRSRHEAMELGELGVDYLYFGEIGAQADAAARDLAAWWAETFEIPAVIGGAPGDDAGGCEFIAIDLLDQTPAPATEAAG